MKTQRRAKKSLQREETQRMPCKGSARYLKCLPASYLQFTQSLFCLHVRLYRTWPVFIVSFQIYFTFLTLLCTYTNLLSARFNGNKMLLLYRTLRWGSLMVTEFEDVYEKKIVYFDLKRGGGRDCSVSIAACKSYLHSLLRQIFVFFSLASRPNLGPTGVYSGSFPVS
jgi:hypothetical protein